MASTRKIFRSFNSLINVCQVDHGDPYPKTKRMDLAILKKDWKCEVFQFILSISTAVEASSLNRHSRKRTTEMKSQSPLSNQNEFISFSVFLFSHTLLVQNTT